MNIGTYGSIGIDVIELIDFNISYEYGFVEIDKAGDISDIQTVSDSVSKLDMKLRIYNNDAKVSSWISEANTKTENELIIGGSSYGDFYIKTIKSTIKMLVPKTVDMSITLWQA